MADFLRSPKNGTPNDGDTFVDVRDGEVIAQVAKEVKGEVVCLEVRKSILNKDKTRKQGAAREKIITQAQEEVQKLYEKK